MFQKFTPRKAKFGNKSVVYKGIVFDSTAECEYYKLLEYKLQVGKIKSFQRQVTFVLIPSFTDISGGKHLGIEYVADFVVEGISGRVTVIDVKGHADAQAKIKRKLFMYKHQDKRLMRVIKFGGHRVDRFENEKRKSKNKREKKARDKASKLIQ